MELYKYLHPTMYLLIPEKPFGKLAHPINLHPTMYLLIQVPWWQATAKDVSFTSHYVSINSLYGQPMQTTGKNLHPTMYLLIHNIHRFNYIIARNLHPTMYLLIPVIIKASLFLNSEALFCLPFKSANRLRILYALNMPEA